MHGQGKYTWKDGRCYEGQYERDRKHGMGTYTWSDGRQYIGMWKDGRQHGEGRYIAGPSERERVGVWLNGKRTEWKS